MLAASTFFLIVMYVAVIPNKSEDWIIFVMIIIALGLGTLAGLLMKKFARFGIVVTAAWLGGVLGSMAYNALLRLITIETYPLLVLWLTILTFAGAAGFFANKFFDVAVIFGSAIIGSFLFFRVNIILYQYTFRELLSSQAAIQTNSLFTKEFKKMELFQFLCTGLWDAWLCFHCFHLSISGMLAIKVLKVLSYICSHLAEHRFRNTKKSQTIGTTKKRIFEAGVLLIKCSP